MDFISSDEDLYETSESSESVNDILDNNHEAERVIYEEGPFVVG